MIGSDDTERRSRTRRRGGDWATRRARVVTGLSLLSRGSVHRATRGAAWLALLVSLALTVAAWRLADTRERDAAHAELERAAAQIASRLSARMLAYQQMLHGAAGLFATADVVSREDWQLYVRTIGLDVLPGIEGLGWAQRVRPDELPAHVDTMRREGQRDYRVFPQGSNDLHGPVTYLEPRRAGNARAIGFDMYADPVRRMAMQEARDSGRPSLTGRVALVQDPDGARQNGFLLYLPVYRGGAAPPATREARREALRGWVYAPFRTADFVKGALIGQRDVEALQFEIRDARKGGATMYVAGDPPDAGAAPPLRIPLDMVDRVWELGVWATSATATSNGALRGSTVVAVAGTIASLLIFGIVWTLATTRSRAVGIADRMTVALRQVNETLEARVRERTASLHDSNQRLATVNDKMRAVNAAFRVIGGPAPIAERLPAVAAQLRAIVPCAIALAVAFRAEAGGAPAIGLDADPGLSGEERDLWRQAALDSDRSGGEAVPGTALTYRLQAPLLDAQGRARGYLLLGRAVGGFPAEDTAVLSQFALLVGTSLSLHETLARERHARGEAERADRAKDEMLAVVSHELRTPLNAIQGWLHVLRRRRADDAALLDRAVTVIQRNLDTQVQLVDDLLDTARIVSGKFRLELCPLDLGPLLRTAVDSVRPMADAKHITLSMQTGPDTFDTVGDASRLEQVVWNLLSNAVKFTPQGGTINVRLERLGWLAQLEVEDSGQGIEADFLPHVFDRFRQADSSSSRSAGGLGLGLALVRHIVQAHGGQVMVHSDGVGRGACFTVSLPLGVAGLRDWAPVPGIAKVYPAAPDIIDVSHPSAAWLAQAGAADTLDRFEDDDVAGRSGTANGPDAPEPLTGLSVLIVEDHDDSRELLAEFLAAQGAQVYPAANGHEAMARLRAMPADAQPAVLLCDIGLPGENGYELLARVRRFEQDEHRGPGARLVAFALSAFTRTEDRERSLEAGFAEHLSKPLAQGELVARLSRLIDRVGDGAVPMPR